MYNYTKEQIVEIKELLPTYTEEEKDEIIRLLYDLAHIYNNADIK